MKVGAWRQHQRLPQYIEIVHRNICLYYLFLSVRHRGLEGGKKIASMMKRISHSSWLVSPWLSGVLFLMLFLVGFPSSFADIISLLKSCSSYTYQVCCLLSVQNSLQVSINYWNQSSQNSILHQRNQEHQQANDR